MRVVLKRELKCLKIRWCGHVPADTPLNKKLMDLHEKYTKQYEAAYDESLREAIVKDFIEDADKLLG